jgi:hypothetical protein
LISLHLLYFGLFWEQILLKTKPYSIVVGLYWVIVTNINWSLNQNKEDAINPINGQPAYHHHDGFNYACWLDDHIYKLWYQYRDAGLTMEIFSMAGDHFSVILCPD